MSAEREVLIGDLSPTVQLAPAEAESVVGPDRLLRGRWQLEICVKRSRPLLFGPEVRRAKATERDGRWVLESTDRCEFILDPPLVVEESEPGLALRTSRLTLRASSPTTPLVSLDDLALSLIGKHNLREGTLALPSRTGPRHPALQKALHDTESLSGYFVERLGTDIIVRTAGIDRSETIDHAGSATLLLESLNTVAFRLCDAASARAPQLRIEASNSEYPPQLGIKGQSLLAVGAVGTGLGDAQSWLTTRHITVENGWLCVDQFEPAEIELRRLGEADDARGRTSIISPREALTFFLHIPPEATQGPVRRSEAQFVYTDSSEALDQRAARGHRHRFYGVRVRGLGSVRRAQEVLDATRATVSLPATGTETFQFRAGLPVRVRSEELPSRLLPKADPRAHGRRRIDMPAGVLRLRCDGNEGGASPIRFDSATEKLELANAQLVGRPVGVSGAAPAHEKGIAGDRFKEWTLDRVGTLRFTANAHGIHPVDGAQWTEPFVSQPDRFGLLEHPGSEIAIDSSVKRDGSRRADAERTRLTSSLETTDPDAKENLVYSALVAALSYWGVECKFGDTAECFSDFDIKLKEDKLDEESAKSYAKRNALNDLQLVYFGASENRIQKFIDENSDAASDQVIWPFEAGLGVLLRKGDAYCFRIMADRGFPPPGIAFDLSSLATLDPTDLGLPSSWFAEAAAKHKALWPRGSNTSGARLDPSDQLWRGILFRSMPLVLPPIPEGVGKKWPVVRKLYDAINDNLVLHYGWKDESGATWSGGLGKSEPIDFTPDGWQNDVRFKLLRVETTGAAGKALSAEGGLEIELPRFTRKGEPGTPLTIAASFAIDLATGEIQRISAAVAMDEFTTTKIPGFDWIRIDRIDTDFRRLTLKARLKASDKIRSALPILEGEIETQLAFNLQNKPEPYFDLTLPASWETNLFGKWPLTIQGIRLRVGDRSELEFRGRLNLGLPGFNSVGADVVVREQAGDWDLNVRVREVSGAIEIGEFKLSGGLSWTRELPEPGSEGKPVSSGDLAKPEVRQRDLWGFLTLAGGGLLDAEIAFRIGSVGEMSFWVGFIRTGLTLQVGPAELRDPGLLISYQADLKDAPQTLRDAISNVAQNVTGIIRPEGDLAAWLTSWEPCSEIGTVVAGSGYFHFDDVVASEPGHESANLSTLVFSDSGLFRLEAFASFLKAKVIRWALAIDLERGRFSAGVQIPEIKVPPTGNPEYVISPGFLALGLSYRKPLWAMLSVGWPEKLGDSEFERDWSKATKVVVSSLVPINTFWGGFRATLSVNAQPGVTVVRLGYAIRAGWTKTFSAGGAGIAKASAELGVAVGGVLEFKFQFGSGHARLLAAPQPSVERTLAALEELRRQVVRLTTRGAATNGDDEILEAATIIAAGLADLRLRRLQLDATVYADAWGKGSAEFLGVTVASISVHFYARFKACGSLNQGVTRMVARGGFRFSVRIGCVEYEAEAELDVWLKRGPCIDGRSPSLAGDLPFAPPLALPAPFLKQGPFI